LYCHDLQIGGIALECRRTTERSSDDGPRKAMDLSLIRRCNGRLALGSLLEHLFRQNPSRKQPPTAVDQDCLVLPRVLSAAPGWLNDFENEMLEEEVRVDDRISDLAQNTRTYRRRSATLRSLGSRVRVPTRSEHGRNVNCSKFRTAQMDSMLMPSSTNKQISHTFHRDTNQTLAVCSFQMS
jgi:hypothetical protein